MTPVHCCCRLQEEADKSRRLTGKQFFLQQAARVDGKDEVLTHLPLLLLRGAAHFSCLQRAAYGICKRTD